MERSLSPFSKQGFSRLIPSALLANRAANLKSWRKKKQKERKEIYSWQWLDLPTQTLPLHKDTDAGSLFEDGLKKETKRKIWICPGVMVDCCTTFTVFTGLVWH